MKITLYSVLSFILTALVWDAHAPEKRARSVTKSGRVGAEIPSQVKIAVYGRFFS
jgi:hypothetical protein